MGVVILALGATLFLCLPTMVWPPLGYVTILPLLTLAFGWFGWEAWGLLGAVLWGVVGLVLGNAFATGIAMIRRQSLDDFRAAGYFGPNRQR